jgi:hypothetical protein
MFRIVVRHNDDVDLASALEAVFAARASSRPASYSVGATLSAGDPPDRPRRHLKPRATASRRRIEVRRRLRLIHMRIR